MHTGPVGRWPGVIMARCCMPRRGAAAGVLLILCSVLRLRPLVGIQLQLSFDCGVVRIHRHGRGAEQGAETRTSRGVPFAGRRRLSRPPPATCPRFGQMEHGGRAQRSGGKGTAITLQVYCDAPALETRTPTASQRHRPRGTRPRPSAVRAALHRIRPRTVWSLPDPAAPNGRKKRR